MLTPMSAKAALERHFLEIRGKALELAAALDRIDRGGDVERVRDDERMTQLDDALRALADGRGDRAVRVQMIFSDAYEEDWARPGQP